jgi:hypothetical protein
MPCFPESCTCALEQIVAQQRRPRSEEFSDLISDILKVRANDAFVYFRPRAVLSVLPLAPIYIFRQAIRERSREAFGLRVRAWSREHLGHATI